MHIEEMQRRAWKTSESHGFHDNKDVPTKLMLIVSEAAEALEDYRKNRMTTVLSEPNDKPVGFASELADIVIRCGDLAGILGIDLDSEVHIKMAFNETRSFKHGDKKV